MLPDRPGPEGRPRYVLMNLLGKGGFSEVFKVRGNGTALLASGGVCAWRLGGGAGGGALLVGQHICMFCVWACIACKSGKRLPQQHLPPSSIALCARTCALLPLVLVLVHSTNAVVHSAPAPARRLPPSAPACPSPLPTIWRTTWSRRTCTPYAPHMPLPLPLPLPPARPQNH